MPIPHRRRVRFDKNPLVEVIFQARFPRLLEIDADLPVKFHSAIRERFPAFNVSKVLEIPISPSQGAGMPTQMRHYEMACPEGQWKVALTGEFIALTTAVYRDWNEFRSNASFVLDAFLRHYKPSFFDRIGLRYRDLISRRELGLVGVEWRELIAPHIAGILANDALNEDEAAGIRGAFALKIRDDLHVQVQHGIVEGRHSDAEFVIDSDFYTETKAEATTDACIRILDGFRPHPNDLFQWCITDRLREAMGPVETDD